VLQGDYRKPKWSNMKARRAAGRSIDPDAVRCCSKRHPKALISPVTRGELNLLKVEPRHSYWLKPTRKFCLMSRPGELRGSCGGENYPIRALRRIGNCVKEAIAVTIQANDQMDK
jgi:hypothetical protein